MDYNYFISTDIERAIRKCDEEIDKRENWLAMGDYTESEHEPIKSDIKRFKMLKKQLEKAQLTCSQLQTY